MITISIVVYNNTYEEVVHCLSQFIMSKIIAVVIICENTEIPCLEEVKLHQFNSKIKYISNPQNTGYGAGHNLAFAFIKDLEQSFYHVVMNLDVNVKEEVFSKIKELMATNESIVQVMPKVLSPDGTIQRVCKKLPTPINLISRRFFGNSNFVKNLDESYSLSNYNYDYILDCPYLSGCFMFLRKSAFIRLNGFDERFFMYPEDIDLTRRMYEIGRTICFPDVEIEHQHAKASYKSKKMLLIHVRGIIKYFNKWGWFFDFKRKSYNLGLENSIKSKNISRGKSFCRF